jgi:hypothetical protein
VSNVPLKGKNSRSHWSSILISVRSPPETYQTWSFTPVKDRHGSIIAYHNPAYDTTFDVIAKRRLATSRNLELITSPARTVKGEFHFALPF